MWRNRVIWLVLAGALAVLFLFTNTYAALTLLLAVLAAAVISGLMMLLPSGKLTAEVVFGEEYSVVLNITNASVVPAGQVRFTVVLTNRLTLGCVRQKYECYVNGRSAVSRKLEFGRAAPGTLECFIEDFCVCDSLGIFQKKVSSRIGDEKVIYPKGNKKELDLSQLILEVEDSTRYSEQKSGPDKSELFAIREYKPGDSPKAIHWKQSAKTDKLMVRDFSLPINSSLVLLLELSQSSEEEIEKCVECFLGTASWLAGNGISCNMAWYNTGSGGLNIREIFTIEDLSLLTEELLASYGYCQPQLGLYAYREWGYLSNKNLLVYVSSDVGGTLIAEVGRQQSIYLLTPESIPQYGG